MSCCGQRRAEMRHLTNTPFQATGLPPAQPVSPVLRAPIALVHTGTSATVARGARTGLTYLFGADGAALEVDERDAPALIASGRFAAARVTSRVTSR